MSKDFLKVMDRDYRYHEDVKQWIPLNAYQWDTDDKVRAMSDAQCGLYIKLLVRQWLDRGLPTKNLWTVVGKTEAEFNTLWYPPLSECFIEENGVLANPRLEVERSIWEGVCGQRMIAFHENRLKELRKLEARSEAARKREEKKHALLFCGQKGDRVIQSTTSEDSSGDMGYMFNKEDLNKKRSKSKSKDLNKKRSINALDEKIETKGVWAGQLSWCPVTKKLKMSKQFVAHLLENGVTNEQLRSERGAMNRWLCTPKGQKKVKAITYWSRFVNTWMDKNIRQQQTNKEMRKFRDEKQHGARTPPNKRPIESEARCRQCGMVLPSHKPLCPEEK